MFGLYDLNEQEVTIVFDSLDTEERIRKIYWKSFEGSQLVKNLILILDLEIRIVNFLTEK